MESNILTIPVELLKCIIIESDVRSILTLSMTCKFIYELINDGPIWCELLNIHKTYDDLTFCIKTNNKIIAYDRKCINMHNTYLLMRKKQDNTFNYQSRTFYQLWKIMKEIGYKDDWDMNRILKYKNLPKDVELLTNEIDKLFKYSMNSYKLYKQLFSSIFSFYKVLITGKRWKETCKYNNTKYGEGVCCKETSEYSVFCFDCRTNCNPADLLSRAFSCKGPHQTKLPQKSSDHEEDHMLDVSIYNERAGIYLEPKNKFLIKREENMLGEQLICIGKLVNGENHELDYCEIKLAEELTLEYKFQELLL